MKFYFISSAESFSWVCHSLLFHFFNFWMALDISFSLSRTYILTQTLLSLHIEDVSSHTLSLHSSITILSICAVDMSCVSLKYLPLSLSFSDVWILLLLCHRKCQDGINECWMCSVQFSIFAQEIIDSWRALFAHSSTQKNFLSKFLKISSVTFRVQGKAENLPKRLLLLLLLSSLLLLCL